MAHRSCVLAETRQDFEVLHVAEDRVVRYERNPEPCCRRGHPTIRLVLLVLSQAGEGRAHLGREQLGLLPRREVAAPVDLVEVDEAGVDPSGPAARRLEDLVGNTVKAAGTDRGGKRCSPAKFRPAGLDGQASLLGGLLSSLC